MKKRRDMGSDSLQNQQAPNKTISAYIWKKIINFHIEHAKAVIDENKILKVLRSTGIKIQLLEIQNRNIRVKDWRMVNLHRKKGQIHVFCVSPTE